MIGFIIGLLIGLTPTIYYIINNKKKPPVERYQRRGIYNVTYNVTRGDWKGNTTIQYEIGELECTTDMSKIEVISLISDQSRFNTLGEKKSFTEQIDKSWVDSSEIKWIVSPAAERNKKIEQILN